MNGVFLRQTFDRILELRDHPPLRLRDLCLDTLHAAVELSDGSCGVALNYDQEGDQQLSLELLQRLGQRILEKSANDLLLRDTLFGDDDTPTLRAVAVAILNALCAPLNRSDGLSLGHVRLPDRLSLQSFAGLAKHVLVIGCGGYLEEALHLSWLEQVTCFDLNFATETRRRRYRPFLENVVEPRRESLQVHLSDGSDQAEILPTADLVCVSGSTLCNDSLGAIVEQATSAGAIILEGHSAGLSPRFLVDLGIRHVVQTPLDLAVPHMLRRYSQQLHRGKVQVGPGPYFDLLFPERSSLVSVAGYPVPRGDTLLLLQARDADDPMIEHECRCFSRALGREVRPWSLLDRPLRGVDLHGCAGVLVGGSGVYGAAFNREPWFLPALESLRVVLRSELPMFASCWGIQALTVALGGRVEVRPDMAEFGSLPVQRCAGTLNDPLFGDFPERFSVQCGHSEAVTVLPAGVVLLASSERCPHQAFKLPGRPVYACQFHAELTAQDLQDRVRRYAPNLGLSSDWSQSEAAETATPEVGPLLLQRFLALC